MSQAQARYSPGHVFGNYRLGNCIGIGGISEVYEAVHQFLGFKVAIKALQLRHVANPQVVQMARAEAIALSRLRHENLVKVSDASITQEGIVWMAMKLLEGHSLHDYLLAKGRLPLLDALRFSRDVADGCMAAHEMGITHRDLKPGNVFITNDLKVVVLDLGMAKFHDFGLQSTGGGKAIGTLRYMAPEQINGEKVDGRTDIYAIGVMLYEMLVGEHPFHRSEDGLVVLNSHQIGVAHVQRTARPLHDVLPGCPQDVSDLVTKATCKDRSGRFPTMSELAQAIRTVRKRLVDLAKSEGEEPVVSTPGGRQHYVAPREPPQFMEVAAPSRRVVADAASNAVMAKPAAASQPIMATQRLEAPPLLASPHATTEPAPARSKPREETPAPSASTPVVHKSSGRGRTWWALAILTGVAATATLQAVLHTDWFTQGPSVASSTATQETPPSARSEPTAVPAAPSSMPVPTEPALPPASPTPTRASAQSSAVASSAGQPAHGKPAPVSPTTSDARPAAATSTRPAQATTPPRPSQPLHDTAPRF